MTPRYRTAEVRERPVRREIRERIAALERVEWGARSWGAAYFERRLRDTELVVLVVRDGGGAVVAYLLAGRDRRHPHALHVEDILVDPAHRGRGLADRLNAALERTARRLGYAELTRHAKIAGGYADWLERRHAGRIVERRDHRSRYGPQRFLRIRLAR